MTKLQKQKSDNWLPKVKLGGGEQEGSECDYKKATGRHHSGDGNGL